MVSVLALLENNSYRHALHHLHIISSRVFRREKAEARSRGSGKVIHMSAIIFPCSVSINRYCLSRLHLAQLGFLEIGCHPQTIDWDDGEQLLSGLYALAFF